MRKQKSESSRGFSITELLIVVGIMGLILLVSAPNFFAYIQMNKLRSSARQFTTDVRAARQRAVTKNIRTKVSLAAAQPEYTIEEWTAGNWSTVATRRLDLPVRFQSTGFSNVTGDTDARPDIVFLNNGTVENLPTTEADRVVVLATTADIPKKQLTVNVSLTGRIQTQ
jgi:prepilin-type N-terminal cleavage/methylation domain-containing protein